MKQQGRRDYANSAEDSGDGLELSDRTKLLCGGRGENSAVAYSQLQLRFGADSKKGFAPPGVVEAT
jgi:hypothetical protein